MAGKSLRNILTNKPRNRDAEVYRQALDLSPVYSDCIPVAEIDKFVHGLYLRYNTDNSTHSFNLCYP